MDLLLVPDLVSFLWLKDYICTIDSFYHIGKISKKFSILLITYQDSLAARSLSLKEHLERHSCSRGVPIIQYTTMQKSSGGPVLHYLWRKRELFTITDAYQQDIKVSIPDSPWPPCHHPCMKREDVSSEEALLHTLTTKAMTACIFSNA